MLSIATFGIIHLGNDILIGISKRKNTTECIIGGKLNVIDVKYLQVLIDKYERKDPPCLFAEYLNLMKPIIEKMNQTKYKEMTVYEHKSSDDSFLYNLFNSDGKSAFTKCERLLSALTLKREIWEELGGLDVSLESIYNSQVHSFKDNIPKRYVNVFELKHLKLQQLQTAEYEIKLLKAHGVDVPIDEIRLMKMNDLNKWVYTGALGVSYDMQGYELGKEISPIREFSLQYVKHIYPKKEMVELPNSTNSTKPDELVGAMENLNISDIGLSLTLNGFKPV